MDDDARFALVKDMRDAQKRYFAKRDNLEECKQLERAVDRMLEERKDGPSLFDGEEDKE